MLARFHGWECCEAGRMRWESAWKLWGFDAVKTALAEPAPDPITRELLGELECYSDDPQALHQWALQQPWTRFCTVVRVVTGTERSELRNGE